MSNIFNLLKENVESFDSKSVAMNVYRDPMAIMQEMNSINDRYKFDMLLVESENKDSSKKNKLLAKIKVIKEWFVKIIKSFKDAILTVIRIVGTSLKMGETIIESINDNFVNDMLKIKKEIYSKKYGEGTIAKNIDAAISDPSKMDTIDTKEAMDNIREKLANPFIDERILPLLKIKKGFVAKTSKDREAKVKKSKDMITKYLDSCKNAIKLLETDMKFYETLEDKITRDAMVSSSNIIDLTMLIKSIDEKIIENINHSIKVILAEARKDDKKEDKK